MQFLLLVSSLLTYTHQFQYFIPQPVLTWLRLSWISGSWVKSFRCVVGTRHSSIFVRSYIQSHFARPRRPAQAIRSGPLPRAFDLLTITSVFIYITGSNLAPALLPLVSRDSSIGASPYPLPYKTRQFLPHNTPQYGKYYIYGLLPTQPLIVDPVPKSRKYKRVEFSKTEIRQAVEEGARFAMRKEDVHFVTSKFFPLHNIIYYPKCLIIMVSSGSDTW